MKNSISHQMKSLCPGVKSSFTILVLFMSIVNSFSQEIKHDRILLGKWLGGLNNEVHVYYDISERWDGSLTGYNGILEFKMSAGPVEEIIMTGDTVSFREIESNQKYTGVLIADSMIIRGKYANLNIGQSWPLTLKYVKNLPITERPQTPVRPFSYREENVVYENKAAGIHIAGTLTMPAKGGHFPAAILITGSGQQNRDDEYAFHHPFLVIADYLTRNGIAVLRLDDRGVGGTTRKGPFFNSTSADYVTDVQAGIQYLRTRSEIDQGMIGLIGHSEGGLVASMAASADHRIAYIVLMASPAGGKFSTGIAKQDSVNARAHGANDRETAIIVDWCNRFYSVVLNEPDSLLAIQKLQKLFAERTTEEKQAFEKTGVSGGTLSIDYAMTPHFKYLCSLNPDDYLKQLTCPVLALMGDKDISGVSSLNLKSMENMFIAAGNQNYKIYELKNMNHHFQTVDPDNPKDPAEIDETISPVVLDILTSWIQKQVHLP